MSPAVLLDTNALIWAVAKPEELGKVARQLIETATSVYFSALSLAEIEIKRALAKKPQIAFMRERLIDGDFRELAFTGEHAKEIMRFGSLIAHDPFDRLLLAQAASAKTEFVTADRALLALDFEWVIDARS